MFEAGTVQGPGEIEIDIGARPVPKVVTPPILLPAVNQEPATHKPTEMNYRGRILANQQRRTPHLYATLAPGGSPKETFGILHPYDFPTGISAINIHAGILWRRCMQISRHHVRPRMTQLVVHGDTVYLCGQTAEGRRRGHRRDPSHSSQNRISASRGGLLQVQIWHADIRHYDEMNAVRDA